MRKQDGSLPEERAPLPKDAIFLIIHDGVKLTRKDN